MTSVTKLRRIKYNQNRCWICREELIKGDLIGISSSGVLCLACAKEKLQHRLSILKDWLQSKQILLNIIKKEMNKNSVSTKYALRELSK
jgi:hypothetical protein